MAQRDFAFVKVIEDGRPLSAYEIRCSKCERTLHFVQHGTKRRPTDAAKPWFAAKGWYVAQRPSADICPDCQVRPKKKPKFTLVENIPTIGSVFQKETVMAAEVVVPLKAEPPREMERNDRRIITEKLDEIYADNRYISPWTDARVASDLGVPQAWVAEVRDSFFGPEGSNAEIDAFLGQLAAVAEEARALALAGATMAHDVEKMREAVLGHSRAAQVCAAKVADLERQARKIEKDIGK